MIGRGLALLLALAAARDDALAGRMPGKPVECIESEFNQGPEILDGRTILYRQNARRIWRTGPIGACPGLEPFAALVIDTYGKRLCRNDRFRPVPRGTRLPVGTCRFDAFTPYDRIR